MSLKDDIRNAIQRSCFYWHCNATIRHLPFTGRYSANVHIQKRRAAQEREQMYISLEEETRNIDSATCFPCFANEIFRPHRWWEFRCKDAACVISSKMRRRGVMSLGNNGGRHRLCALETWTRQVQTYLQLTPLRWLRWNCQRCSLFHLAWANLTRSMGEETYRR